MNLPAVTYMNDLSPERRRQIKILADQIEAPHERIVYGQHRTVRPTFCPAIIGDGAHLLIVTAVRTAPAYHAILIDSSWTRPSRSPLSLSGVEADLDDPDRRDLLEDVLVDLCGDADRWHEENGEELVTPHGLYPRDMGFYYGIEPLGNDGGLVQESLAA